MGTDLIIYEPPARKVKGELVVTFDDSRELLGWAFDDLAQKVVQPFLDAIGKAFAELAVKLEPVVSYMRSLFEVAPQLQVNYRMVRPVGKVRGLPKGGLLLPFRVVKK